VLAVIAAGAALWGLGALTGASRRARWAALATLYAAVVVGHLVLPEGHGIRAATGGSAAPWLLLGGVAAVVAAYGAGLARLRARAHHEHPAAAAPPVAGAAPAGDDRLGPDERERYLRHILLREIGGAGQRRLKRARVLVVGAGGLGSPALLYLAAAGVGTIGVIDPDTVEAGNLQRQIAHGEDRIGMPKVFSAEAAMRALNPHVRVRPYHRALSVEIADALFADYDLIVEGTDSPVARRLANAAAVARGLPLLSAALTQWEGQIALWHPAAGGPCYACVFPEDAAAGLAPACAEAGVAGPLPGILGSMLALEAVKWIAGAGEPLLGRLVIYDGLSADMRVIRTAPRPGCAVCGGGAARAPDAAAAGR
jgi:molybdopterin/thiamine biosynthesis adenylyltransferase